MNTATSHDIKENLISKGLESFIKGSYSQATTYFEEILNNAPNDSDALHHLAGCQIQLQQYESAQENIQKVLSLDSKNSLAWFRLGQIHYICKRYESAVDSFGKAIEINPKFADAWFMGGQALLQNGNINDGMLALENALLQNSSSVIFNEIFSKYFIEYKRDVGTLVITGGIGDILLCLPFLLQNKKYNFKVNVLTHFKGAKRIFDSLSLAVNKIAYYSNDDERLKLQPEIIGPREYYPCPKRWFFNVNPFNSKIINFESSRPILGIQLGGSAISIDLQSKIGLPKKSLPVDILHNIIALDAFNIILFGSQEEINSYGLVTGRYLNFACYQNIDESLSLVSQCDCFVGSDSAIKSMAAMLQVPTFVWMGDYKDQYRDDNFIDPYTKSPSFKTFRYKDIAKDHESGQQELTDFLKAIGILDYKKIKLSKFIQEEKHRNMMENKNNIESRIANQNDDALQDLKKFFQESPEPSFKVTNYFQIYSNLFSHLRGEECTFIETGVLNGGSLFMWRKWLGNKARIIGVDLNPAAKKWEKFGFEIYIGDQGDPLFWQSLYKKIGQFDVLLDDGGHQSFQQIVTLSEAIKVANNKCIVAIEDTCTSFFEEFSGHHNHSFLEYAKDSTDSLLAKTKDFYAGQFPKIGNEKVVEQFSSIYSIQFFSGMVAYFVDPAAKEQPELIWNHLPKNGSSASDFRYNGTTSAKVDWPNLFEDKQVVIKGGTAKNA